VPVYLSIHLLAIATNSEWWGLRDKLRQKRSWYAKRHQILMNINDLNKLEKEFNTEENRFEQLAQTIGNIQSENIYPSIVGFERSVLYILLKLIMPVIFAAILVFVDTVWIAVWSVLMLFLGYFVLQLYFVKANISGREFLNYGLFMFVGYFSVFLFLLES